MFEFRPSPTHRRSGVLTVVAAAILATGLAMSPVLGTQAAALEVAPVCADTVPSPQTPVVIKLATLAPNGSAWHEILKEMAARWREASGGLVTLRIYPGGVAGEEIDVLRRIEEGQLQAGSLSLAGLSRITPYVYVLAIPMAMESWEDLARVRDRMQPRLESVFEENGFVLLNWGDIGWVHFFLPQPDASFEAVKKHRFVAWSDDSTIDLWKESGFRNAYFELSDVLPALREGRVDAVGTTPLFMLANRWYPEVPYMVDLSWTPLVGATLIDRDAWQSIPAEYHAELMRIAHQAGERMQSEIRRMEADAIAAMEARGMEVIHPSDAVAEQWRRFFEGAYPHLRGPIIPEAWFDEVLSMVNESR